VLPLDLAWPFAQAWFGDQLDAAYRSRRPEQALVIFQRLGLSAPFWSATG